MPGVGVRTAAAEQVQRTVETVAEIAQGQGREPPGGEFDGQWHAVEPAHDVGDDLQVGLRRRRPTPDPPGAVDEDRHGRDLPQITVGSGQGQGRQPRAVLGRQAERLPTGGQDREALATGEDQADGLTDGLEQVLAVVDHQHPRLVAQDGDTGRQDVTLSNLEVEGLGEGVRKPGGIGHRGEE